MRSCVESEFAIGSFRRPFALGLALLIHVCLILALVNNARTIARAGKTGKEAIISLLPAEAPFVWIRPAEPSVRFETPALTTVLPPEIAIDEPRHANDADTNGKIYEPHLPPRLDPQAPNAAPELLADLRKRLGSGQAYIVIVRALVLETGAVGEAQIAASSGIADLDNLALAEVRDHWHFLPATTDGRNVPGWLSVEVLFRPA